ncbi:hypothetical protein DFH08DRAFT_753676 [Mycena albidolilacea]|uniref:Tail specific protease domain-containing protein n=1 Tax=Mycena albidolilacea TaxID=1033008 RepID=A0AAD7EFV9_9AGAR|nr:hypothetical protein DFH08DRAFT_753676 [Mycena albidolilacea]
MLSSFLIVAASAGLAHAKSANDPCTVASASSWVSSKAAHACELNVPFNKNQSLAVIDSNIKALPWYSLETWFEHSPNPLIPHDVNVSALLSAVQAKTAKSGYKTDWDFNTAVTDAWNREADGHTLFSAACTESFSYNLPFSIATLASSPAAHTAYPTFLVNYEFPNQGRTGLEAYFEALGVKVRPYDGARILAIDGVDASTYLVDLATESSIYKGLVGAYETVNPRYMRLMSRYSADTASGAFTQEVGRFGQRAFYPGADSVTVLLQTAKGPKSLTVPWAATFVGSGNTTASFIAETCALPTEAAVQNKRTVEERVQKREVNIPARVTRKKGVVRPDNQGPVREEAQQIKSLAAPTNYAQPNLTSFGHITTLDVYQLAAHPHVGVLYFEQFEPSDGTDFESYINGISATLYTGLRKLKDAGVKHVLIDNSGNRGGYIYAGAVALWSLFPTDLYPGFPAVLRNHELTRQESVAAAASNDQNSEYFYGFYRDLNYTLLTSNTQFADPPVPTTINGVADAYTQPFFDDFGAASDVTNATAPAFDGLDYVIVANSICASTCSVFSSYLFQKHGVRSAVFGGTPSATTSQFDGGVKGSEVTDFSSVLGELQLAGLSDAETAPQPFPINADLSLNFRNAIPYVDQEDGILEYVWEAGTKKYQFTKELFNKPQEIWEFVAEEFFGQD